MAKDDVQPLWREVVGDTEPWRRGRIFLILLAAWQLLSQVLMIGGGIAFGDLDRVLPLTIGATISWLLFYFIWIGVHWVRWLAAAFSGLVGFAKVIWGMRDGNAVFVLDGTIGFATSAYLGLAPAVYFFAQHQKERVRWKESLAVAAVFGLLLASFGAALIALSGFKNQVEADGREFADKAFRRLFVNGDAEFLKRTVTTRLMKEEGWERLSYFMLDRDSRVGAARNLRPTQGRIRFTYKFPTTLISAGPMTATAESEGGPVQLFIFIGRAGGEWEIDALSWRFVMPEALGPPR